MGRRAWSLELPGRVSQSSADAVALTQQFAERVAKMDCDGGKQPGLRDPDSMT